MKELRTEREITDSWVYSTNEPLVSITCITFNQEPYIENTLRGFLVQKTDFPIEILIHDDASTDGTADIIRRFEKEYPNIIKSILQTENQYSKKISIDSTFNYNRAKGIYIAICEGDDYWTNEHKLQQQFNFMQRRLDISFTCHNAYIHDLSNNSKYLFNKKLSTGMYTTKDLLNREWFIPTASLFIRKDALKDLPSWIGLVRSQDLVVEITASIQNNFWYQDELNSVYRKNATGSISSISEKPWNYLILRVFMMKKMFLYVPIKYRHLVVKDILLSYSKISYLKIRYGKDKKYNRKNKIFN